ncbi:MAG: DUF1361 domain-containing protein [Saprospiraceae bacterium]|nr:DUF1361 domain-containing protein [Saprospiraceae bacterium]MBK8373186.1 DUF1361 domain-containing protein [Saprospiraceae bacterium]MBK8820648.1 DUF1361 domain-containing protein [Saprospiraceae bacterium]MBK8853970.1 DUF1361 domain-containing protein [Saprospiraceae bacterium]
MTNLLSDFNIPRYIRILLYFTLANLAILALRNYIVGDHMFNFLKSNLLSGIAPFILALCLTYFSGKLNNFWFILGSMLWLLFYPNSPYMISDLIHLHEEVKDSVIPQLIVFDTFIVFSIAMLSLFYGFVSLKLMFNLFRQRFGDRWAHGAIFFSLILSCLGFYMGRAILSEVKLGNGYLYSWEVFLEPAFIINIVLKNLFPISDHIHVYAMMALFGFVQYQMLVMMKDVSDIEEAKAITKD